MKIRIWLVSWFIIVSSTLSIFAYWVYKIDPFFHYHKPNLDSYFYELNNERSQNDGIIKHFDYDAMITGTSMTENFRKTEMDKVFGCNSIKVPFSGASFKEVNDIVIAALKSNQNLRIVVRGLDCYHFLDEADVMREDLGNYPTYLYDDNPFNDVEYLLNRDIVFGRTYQMKLDSTKADFKPGITTFDDYSRWQPYHTFGINTVRPNGIRVYRDEEEMHLSDREKEIIKDNIEKNVTDIAGDYPNVEFYYFYTPYSIVWWCGNYKHGGIAKQIEAEKYVTELILPHKNIHLYSFQNRTDIITDLNNYKDDSHYGSWVNSLILKWMHDGENLLTENNYEEFFNKEYAFYSAFDYESINRQEDYEADYLAGALLNKELSGAEPKEVLLTNNSARVTLDFAGGYRYLSFNIQKEADYDSSTVCVYNENNELIASIECEHADTEKHQHVIDLSPIDERVIVIFNAGYEGKIENADSGCIFSDIYMY